MDWNRCRKFLIQLGSNKDSLKSSILLIRVIPIKVVTYRGTQRPCLVLYIHERRLVSSAFKIKDMLTTCELFASHHHCYFKNDPSWKQKTWIVDTDTVTRFPVQSLYFRCQEIPTTKPYKHNMASKEHLGIHIQGKKWDP